MARKVWTFNVAVDFWDHRKSVSAGVDGRALFLCSLGWAGKERTDGHIPTEALPLLAGKVGLLPPAARKAARKLVDVGLWEPEPAGWLIHDYTGPDGWQLSAAEREARADAAAERKRKSRDGPSMSRVTSRVTNDVTPPVTDSVTGHASDAVNDAQRGVRGNGFGFAGLDSSLNPTSATNSDSGSQPSPNGEIYDQVRADFETFWDNFPKRHGRLRNKATALQRWRKLKPAERANALVAVVNYAAERGDGKLSYAADPARWLKDRDWVDYLEPVSPVTRLDQRKPLARRSAAEIVATRRDPPGGAS